MYILCLFILDNEGHTPRLLQFVSPKISDPYYLRRLSVMDRKENQLYSRTATTEIGNNLWKQLKTCFHTHILWG